jgi:hypothetical protein
MRARRKEGSMRTGVMAVGAKHVARQRTQPQLARNVLGVGA